MKAILVMLAVIPFVSGCSDTCKNTVVSQVDSPGGKHRAIMFQRDCGATTGFSTQISIVEPGGSADGSGNAFRADDDHGAAKTGSWGGPWAEMEWQTADRLIVRYATKSRIFDQKAEVEGVSVSYQSTDQ